METSLLSRRGFIKRAGAGTGLGILGAVAGCERRSASRALVVYSAGPRWFADAAADAYTAATARPVELFTATTGQIMAKLRAERYNRRADVVLLASRLAAEHLKRERMLTGADVQLGGASARPWHDADGMYFATSAAAVGVAVRRPFAAVPNDWADVLSGRWYGRSAMPSPARSGTASDFVVAYAQFLGEEAWRLFIEARRAGLEIGGGNNQVIAGLLTGAYGAVVSAADYLVYKQIEGGAPVAMLFPPSGAPVVERPVAVLRGSRLIEEGAEFIRCCFSAGVQRAAADGHLIPADPAVGLSEVRRQGGEIRAMPLDLTRGLAEQPRVLRRFQYEVERAVVVR